ncbi:hypothetical protein WOLCODRAFT_157605 [Wolfiporia cocos MD-104 SS10]|uniref:Uncharacterized protein n=1 Tax=Wolfiporia cocos (strain MD-104) TaxID=742152 RepID=A0A2H3J5G4_WOLCO|nr:hypothetical protein WOLCODRAFT_157605 [Wolfiporia cocos MD-104 SS10]
MSTLDDPRDPKGEVPMTFPDTWQNDSADGFSATVMFVNGLIMVTRNRPPRSYLAWPALLMSFNSMINQHPLRTKDGGQSPFTTILLAISALITSYLPLVLLGPKKQLAQTPLPVASP